MRLQLNKDLHGVGFDFPVWMYSQYNDPRYYDEYFAPMRMTVPADHPDGLPIDEIPVTAPFADAVNIQETAEETPQEKAVADTWGGLRLLLTGLIIVGNL